MVSGGFLGVFLCKCEFVNLLVFFSVCSFKSQFRLMCKFFHFVIQSCE